MGERTEERRGDGLNEGQGFDQSILSHEKKRKKKIEYEIEKKYMIQHKKVSMKASKYDCSNALHSPSIQCAETSSLPVLCLA